MSAPDSLKGPALAPVTDEYEHDPHHWPDSDALLFKGLMIGLPLSALLWAGIFWLGGAL